MGPVLCLVTDRRIWGDDWQGPLIEQVRLAARAGIHLIQVRERDLSGGALRELVARCLEATRGTRSRILVNDRLDVALAAGAHGVHLRGDSPPASRVRLLCPRPFLIGRSIHSAAEAGSADRLALDYLMFGTVFATPSKPGREPAGAAELAAAVAATAIPVLAIGGVTFETMPEVTRTGAAGAAGIGIFATDPASSVRWLAGQRERIDTSSGPS